MKCIYCLKDKSLDQYRKREHVIPQCFGKFAPNNIILRNIVCDKCNELFGKNIELFWGRDSFEAIERLRHGIKPKDKLRSRRRIESRIAEGKFKGAIVYERLDEKSGKLVVEKPIQAGFYNKNTQEYEYFESGNIPVAKELIERGFEIKGRTVYLIAGENEIKHLEMELINKGIRIVANSELIEKNKPGNIVKIQSNMTVDRVIMRGICKIAFNYLASVAGSHFLFSDSFDGIRKFILCDEGNSSDYLAVNQPPILHDDQIFSKFNIKVTQGHLIILTWSIDKLICRLSLFNVHTYLIILCKNYSGIWMPIKSGHHFDIQNKEVNRLLSISKALLP